MTLTVEMLEIFQSINQILYDLGRCDVRTLSINQSNSLSMILAAESLELFQSISQSMSQSNSLWFWQLRR